MAEDGRSDSETDDTLSESRQQEKELIWDQILLYVSTFGLTLSLIPVVARVLVDRSVACNSPGNFTGTRDQLNYVVVWCSRHVRSLEELPLLILFQSLCLIAPHVTWKAYASAAFEEFFSGSLRVGKLRMKTTGSYDEDTIRLVRHLWDRYTRTHSVRTSYRVKLFLHFFVCLIFLPIIIVLYDGGDLLSARDIFCPNIGGDRIQVNVTRGIPTWTVWCTHASSLSFQCVWIANVCLLLLGFLASVRGLWWLHTSHGKELDYRGQCDFYYHLGISYGDDSLFITRKLETKVHNDFNFLLMMLYGLDKGQGEVFRNLIVEFLLQERWKTDYENYLLFLFKISPQSCMHPHGRTALNNDTVQKVFHCKCRKRDASRCDDLPSLGDHLLRLCTRGRNKVDAEFKNALLLFSGSRGFALSVAKLSRETFAVEFSPYYKPELSTSSQRFQEERREKILEEKFENLTFLRVPNNITNTTSPFSAELFIKLRQDSRQRKTREFDLIVVSCLESHFRISAVRLTLENLFSQCTKNKCLIVFCSFERVDIKSILGNLNDYLDDCVLETKITSNLELAANEDIADFKHFGERVRVYLKLVQFNLDNYWEKTQSV